MCSKCWRNARAIRKTDWYSRKCCAHGFARCHKRNKPNRSICICCFRYAAQSCAFIYFSHFLLILATGLLEPAELFSSFSLFQAASRICFLFLLLRASARARDRLSLALFVRVCAINFSENWPFRSSPPGSAAASFTKYCVWLKIKHQIHLIRFEQRQAHPNIQPIQSKKTPENNNMRTQNEIVVSSNLLRCLSFVLF